jgi:hypothetical protein
MLRRNPGRTGVRATSGTHRGEPTGTRTPDTATRSCRRTSTTDQRSSSDHQSWASRVVPAVHYPVYRAAQDQADPADPADPAGLDPADPENRAIRVAPGDMNRAVATAGTAATGRADTSPAGTTRVDLTALVDLVSPGDTTRADLTLLGRTAGPQDRRRVRTIRAAARQAARTRAQAAPRQGQVIPAAATRQAEVAPAVAATRRN